MIESRCFYGQTYAEGGISDGTEYTTQLHIDPISTYMLGVYKE